MRIDIVEADPPAPVAFFQEIDRHVHGDRMNPRIKCGLLPEAGNRAERLGKNLLEQVVGVLVVGRHIVNQPVKSGAVSDDQVVKRRHVSPFGAGHQFIICGLQRVIHAGIVHRIRAQLRRKA